MVHHTPSKTEDRSVPVFIHVPMSHPWAWCVVLSVWIWSHCLVACTMVYQPHQCIHWLIERGVNTCMDGWSSWNPRQRIKCASLYSSIHGTSLECQMVSLDIIPFFYCLCYVRPTSTMYSLMNWEGWQHLYGWLERMVHYTPSNAEDKSVLVFIHLPIAYLWAWGVVSSLWMLSPCLVDCATVN